MRHDFDDQIQVRYTHTDGESFDTWVSGEEVLGRINSAKSEERLRALSSLDLAALRKLKEQLPEKGKQAAWETLKERMADSVEDTLGDSIISDSLADAVRGYDDDQVPDANRWRILLRDSGFKALVLELAWIQLEGSLPDEDVDDNADDWV
jgi:hypothetical protein